MIMEKRSTGISGLDQVLEGGLPCGTIVLIQGNPLSGSDLLARQFWDTAADSGTYLMLDGEVESGMLSEFSPERIEEYGQGKVIIVDSLSTILNEYGIDITLAFLRSMKEQIRRTGGNLIVLTYPGLHTPLEEVRLLRAVDLFFEMQQEVVMNEVSHLLIIHKVVGMPVPLRVFPYFITEHGVELSTSIFIV
jgi:KaiC/GvpD/RAD55 family RecA-like ATPase